MSPPPQVHRSRSRRQTLSPSVICRRDRYRLDYMRRMRCRGTHPRPRLLRSHLSLDSWRRSACGEAQAKFAASFVAPDPL